MAHVKFLAGKKLKPIVFPGNILVFNEFDGAVSVCMHGGMTGVFGATGVTLSLQAPSQVSSCTLLYTGVCWCILVFTGVNWCLLVYNGVCWCLPV